MLIFFYALFIFFFKQKTAYEMVSCDWSSDVCSSDLGGNAINDKHPRTAMGYTKDGKLIILMIEGRNTVAHGATLGQEAQILKDLACWEALNLDGGGSSCMLVNGKETIKTSDKEGQR